MQVVLVSVLLLLMMYKHVYKANVQNSFLKSIFATLCTLKPAVLILGKERQRKAILFV